MALTKCPAHECDGGVFTFKWGPNAGKMRPCFRCNGTGQIDREAEKVAKAQAARYVQAMEMLREECRRQTGRRSSRLEDDVEVGIMSLEKYESDRMPKLVDSVLGGRLQACIDALVEYGKANPLPAWPELPKML